MEEYKYLRYIGGRKFALAVLALISATAMVYFGKIDSAGFTTCLLGIIGAYTAGNVFQNNSTGAD